MTQAEAHFLPWLRVGAAATIGEADPLAGSLPSGAAIRPWVRVTASDPADGGIVSQDARLYGPGHVTGLGPVVVRVTPAPAAPDAEPNYLVTAEVRPADLPWRFTPAGPGARSQLRPWLVLVAVRRQEGVTLGPEPGSPLPVLRIEAPAAPSAELPDLSDSAAWVHVQASVPASLLAATLTTDPSAALARFLCPRQLRRDASWIACLVPAFDLGVRAGLGDPAPVADTVEPAWDVSTRETRDALDATVVRLPVYHSWEFATGPGGDFESLARRLRPDLGDTTLGRVPLRVTAPGPPLPPDLPRKGQRAGDLVGGLRTPGVRRRELPSELAAWYARELTRLLDEAASRPAVPGPTPPGYDPVRDDPVVAPPFHGATQASATAVPRDGTDRWLAAVNLDPQLRAVAGLGAAVVRANQEALVASAWAQAGDLEETLQALDTARLAVSAGRGLAARVAGLDPGWTTQVTRGLHPWATSQASNTGLARALWRTVPRGLIGAPMQRVTRPSVSVGRGWRGLAPERAAHTTPAVTQAFLDATRAGAPQEDAAVLRFAAVRAPVDAWHHDPLLDQSAVDFLPAAATTRLTPDQRTALDREAAAQRARAGARRAGRAVGPVGGLEPTPDQHPLPGGTGGPVAVPLDLSGAAGAVVASLDPLPAVRTRLLARIPGAAALLPAELGLPALTLHPTFPDPLSADLVRLDARYLLPGAEELPDNRVCLVVADDDFVATLLAGANTEMARELLWREYPTSPTGTFFARFWDTGPGGPEDILPISGWHRSRPGAHVVGVGAADLAVLLVRGDVVRRYPELHVFAARAVWEGAVAVPDLSDTREPVLLGVLDRATRFYGLPVSATDLRGNRSARPRTAESAGWFVGLEEPATGPRFGLDEPAEDGSHATEHPATWDDLSWGHLAGSGQAAEDVTFAVARKALPPRSGPIPEGPVWGHNSAHMAAITYQRPYRLLLHADLLLPAASPTPR